MRAVIFVFLASTLGAQSSSDPYPPLRGVYYQVTDQWVSLPLHLVNPQLQSRVVREVLNVGRPDAVLVIPGPHAEIQINVPRPTLYVRGFPASDGLFLVRQKSKSDYRELRMHVSGDFDEWIRFRPRDLREFDLKQVSPGMLSLTPRVSLAPGEYAVVSTLEPGFRGIRVEYDFSVQ